MCQATVYLDGKEIMQDVIRLEPTADGVQIMTFFESPLEVPAVVCEIDLLKHRVMLESYAENREHE
jgi:predicted RNA-binding protein